MRQIGEAQQGQPVITKACAKEIIMTREDVLKLFPEATNEQITNLLNQTNSEMAKEKNKLNQYKEKSALADELQKKLDELENGKLTELEKVTKELGEANAKIAEMQRNNTIRDMREKAMTDFRITAEQAKTVILDDGAWDTATLGKIIADKESASAIAKEQEIARNAGNPNSSANINNDTNSEAKEVAKRVSGATLGTTKETEAIVESYM